MKIGVKIEPASLRGLRDQLLSGRRGAVGAFKLAAAESVHMWRDKYAPLHFTGAAYSLYGASPAGYLRQTRSSRAGATITVRGTTFSPPYSRKEIYQVDRGYRRDRSPAVFSGRTREGILRGQFSVRGSSQTIRGSWNSVLINWQALAARGAQLGRMLIETTPREIDVMRQQIQDKFFPYYLKMVENKTPLPHISETPRIA